MSLIDDETAHRIGFVPAPWWSTPPWKRVTDQYSQTRPVRVAVGGTTETGDR